MITQEELNEIKHGIYKFHWASGGSSIVAVGVTREGNRWYAPLNWSSTAEYPIFSDGQVVKYELLMDHKGNPHFESTNSSFNRIQEALNNTASTLDQLEKDNAEHNRKIRKNLRQTRIGFSLLFAGLVIAFAFALTIGL